MTKAVLDTARLRLRRIDEGDAEFLLELLTDPDFIRFIGDRGVHSIDDARAYVRTGPMVSYERFGFGLWAVVSKPDGCCVGICGLLKRDALDDVDVGFAFLPAFRGRGLAFEAVTAVLSHAGSAFGLSRVVAVVNPDNASSKRLLLKAGLRYERLIRLSPDGPQIELFG